jgi:hypothetical protein
LDESIEELGTPGKTHEPSPLFRLCARRATDRLAGCHCSSNGATDRKNLEGRRTKAGRSHAADQENSKFSGLRAFATSSAGNAPAFTRVFGCTCRAPPFVNALIFPTHSVWSAPDRASVESAPPEAIDPLAWLPAAPKPRRS